MIYYSQNMKKNIILFIIFLFILNSSVATINNENELLKNSSSIVINGNKKIRKEERKIGKVNTLILRGLGILIIEPSNQFSLTVEAEENLLQFVKSDYKPNKETLELIFNVNDENNLHIKYNGRNEYNRIYNENFISATEKDRNRNEDNLYINYDKEGDLGFSNNYSHKIYINKPIIYHLKIPHIHHIITSGATELRQKNSNKENYNNFIIPEKNYNNLKLESKGISIISINSKSVSLEIESNSASCIVLPKVKATEYDIKTYGASKVVVEKNEAKDKINYIKVKSHGASKISLPNFFVKQIYLHSNGASRINIANIISKKQT